jgi:uncharacterized protein
MFAIIRHQVIQGESIMAGDEIDAANDGANQQLQLTILDGIEFNERFRYSDVASEIAFLTMELDAAQRPDLSRAFVESYILETVDHALLELLPFYSCCRACAWQSRWIPVG